MNQKWKAILLLLLGFSCTTGKKETPTESNEPLAIPPSYLSFTVDFTVKELEEGVNKILPFQLLDKGFPMQNVKDSLFLKVDRTGKMDMAVRDTKVYASIPLTIDAAIKKKVLGVTLSNKGNPINIRGFLKAATTISLNEQWDMEFECEYLGFELDGNPRLSIMGLDFQVENTIQDALATYSDQLSDIICKALHDAIDFKKPVEKVWMDLQSPQRIAKNPVALFLSSTPIALNAQLKHKSKDTLSVQVEYRTQISISPDKKEPSAKVPLTNKKEPLQMSSAILAYPEVMVPYAVMKEEIKKLTAGQRYTYESYQVTITDVAVGSKENKLLIELTTKGDLEGVISISGTPELDDSYQLTLKDFTYEIEAENEWLAMTDWVAHGFIEDYLAEQLTVNTAEFFENLDQKIMDGLAKSRVSEKFSLKMEIDQVSSYQTRLTADGLQWIFYVEGSAGLNLKKDIFKKKNR